MKEQLNYHYHLVPGWTNLLKTGHEELLEVDPNYCVTRFSVERKGLLIFTASAFVANLEDANKFHEIVERINQEASATCRTCGFNGQLCVANMYNTLFGSVYCENCFIEQFKPSEPQLKEYQELMRSYKGLEGSSGSFVTRVV